MHVRTGDAGRHLLRRGLSLLGAALLTGGCERAPDPLAVPAPSVPVRVSVQLVAGDVQVGPAGRELPEPLRVRVTDEDDAPVAGYVLNFRVVAGGGSVYAGAARTDAEGRAADWWTLGPESADTQRVEVRAVDPATAERRVVATFRALTARPAPGFALAATPSSISVRPGASADVAVVVTRAGGFAGEVALSASGAPEGVRVTFGAAPGGAASVPATIAVAAGVAPGTYPIAVRGSAGDLPDQSVTLTLTVAAPPPPPPPGALTSGRLHAGRIERAGQIDSWSFEAAQGDYVVLSVGEGQTSPEFSPWLRLVGPNGAELAADVGAAAAQVARAIPASGRYTVTVAARDVRAAPGVDYALSFVRAPGTHETGAGDEGGTLTNGALHAGRITTGDVDVWTFAADQGDYLAVSMAEGARAAAAADFAPWIRIVGPGGELVRSVSNTSAAQFWGAARVTGTYTVIVGTADVGGDATGDYRVTLVRAPGTATVSPGDEGGAVANAETRAGRIELGDLDAWTFAAEQGDQFVLTMAEGAPASLTADFAPWLRVVDPTGAEIAADVGAVVARVTGRARVTGTYTVIAASGYTVGRAGTGDYRVTLAKSPGAPTPPAGDDGGRMTTGTAYTGRITTGDLDVWSFGAVQGGDVVVTIARVAGANATADFRPGVRIVDPSGQVVRTASDPTSARAAFRAPTTGTYTVIVASEDLGHDASGDYVLTVTGASAAIVGAWRAP